MRRSPRFVPSDLPPGPRRVYLAATAFFALTFAALVWPVYPFFAGIRPRVLGLPLSLVWVTAWVVAGFLVLAAVHLWEGRRGGDDGAAARPDPPDADGGEGGEAPAGGEEAGG